MRTLTTALILSTLLLPLSVAAQTPAPAPAPAPAAAPPPAEAPPAATPEAPKKKGGGPSLGLSPEAPQAGGRLVSPAEPAPVVAAEPSTEWKFDVTGYFRAPMRFSWGPATTQACTPAPCTGPDQGTQFRSPPLIPDANYIDWRYTNSFVAPWTELNFHYGNDRVKATVQIASYNLTDPGYRRLESNLGINQAFITLLWPELGGNENLHLTATVGGFTNRYGAAGRYDAGKYETYLFGRTHVAGETLNFAVDVGNDWTFQVEQTFGSKLETIPFYGPPLGNSLLTSMPLRGDVRQALPAWEPYPGPKAMEATFVASGHLGAVWKKMLIMGLHYIDTFANDNERATAYQGMRFGPDGRGPTEAKPSIKTMGFDAKLLGGVLGDGYIGFSHLDATNAIYLMDAIEVLHSFGGWQLHDNYFGLPGGTDAVTGKIDTVEFQYSFSFAQLFWYPQAFWGQASDLIATVFMMYNHIDAATAPTDKKLKFGAEVTYLPLAWFGVGGRYDAVQPDMHDSTANFSVISPRLYFRTDFVTHEQIMVQYSHYFYGSAYAPGGAGGMYPWNSQTGASGMGVDKDAAQIAAIIWF